MAGIPTIANIPLAGQTTNTMGFGPAGGFGAGAPPDINVSLQQIQRQREIANALFANGLKGGTAAVTSGGPGGERVRVNPLEPLADIFEAYAGTKLNQNLDKKTLDVSNDYYSKSSGAMSDFGKLLARDPSKMDENLMQGMANPYTREFANEVMKERIKNNDFGQGGGAWGDVNPDGSMKAPGATSPSAPTSAPANASAPAPASSMGSVLAGNETPPVSTPTTIPVAAPASASVISPPVNVPQGVANPLSLLTNGQRLALMHLPRKERDLELAKIFGVQNVRDNAALFRMGDNGQTEVLPGFIPAQSVVKYNQAKYELGPVMPNAAGGATVAPKASNMTPPPGAVPFNGGPAVPAPAINSGMARPINAPVAPVPQIQQAPAPAPIAKPVIAAPASPAPVTPPNAGVVTPQAGAAPTNAGAPAPAASAPWNPSQAAQNASLWKQPLPQDYPLPPGSETTQSKAYNMHTGEGIAKTETTLQSNAQSAHNTLPVITEMINTLPGIDAGPAAQGVVFAKGLLKQAGFDSPALDKVVDNQKFAKEAYGLATDNIKDKFGGRIAVQEVKFQIANNPSELMTPIASASLLVMKQAEKQRDAEKLAIYDNYRQHGGSAQRFETWYTANVPPLDYAQVMKTQLPPIVAAIKAQAIKDGRINPKSVNSGFDGSNGSPLGANGVGNTNPSPQILNSPTTPITFDEWQKRNSGGVK